jgi:hypothetical protein
MIRPLIPPFWLTSPLRRLRAGTAPGRGRALLVALAVLVVAGVALAGTAVTSNFAEVHKPSKGVTESSSSPTFVTAFTNLDGTDSTTWDPATALTGRTIVTGGDGTLEVQTRLSAAGATACIAVCRRARDGTFQGSPAGVAALQTATAGAGGTVIYDGTGYYGETLVYNVAGWYAAEIRVYDVSGSSTVSLKPSTVGVASRTAE